MNQLLIKRTASAYTYPLLIKNLLAYPVVDNPDQEIVYRDLSRYDYRTLRERICRLANLLTGLGVNRETPWRSWIGIAIVTSSVSLPCR